MSQYRDHRGGGNKAVFGFFIILAGLAILLKQVGVLSFIHFQTYWPLILIAVGIFIGVRNRFSTNAPFIFIAVGIFHLIPAFSFRVGEHMVDSEDLVIPIILVGLGLFIMLRAGKKKPWQGPDHSDLIADSTLRADIVFGGRKEIVTSKDFKGGKVTATFGGCEINLLQADTTGSAIVLEVRATFGGCEIIVPSDWEIKNEIESVFGSVEDQRSIRPSEQAENRKTLVLRGSCVFGGVEIKSF